MKIHFKLRYPDKEESSILMHCNDKAFPRRRLIIGTGAACKTKFWDSKSGRVRQSRSYAMAGSINQHLNQLEAAAMDTYNRFLSNKEPLEPEAFRAELPLRDGIKVEDTTPEINDFMVWLESVIEEPTKNDTLSKNTLISRRAWLKNLQSFVNESRIRTPFTGIDLSFRDKYVDWMISKGLKGTSIKIWVDYLKSFCAKADDKNYPIPPDFRKSAFKFKAKTVRTIITLSPKELERLMALDLKVDDPHGHTRDALVMGCYLGLRYSDMKKLTKENIKGKFIVVRTTKTKTTVHIPIGGIVSEILAKRGGEFPDRPWDGIFNRQAREVCEMAKIDEPITREFSKGGKWVVLKKPKHEFISSHVMRRSFATNAYESGLSSAEIMQITGHSTESQLFKYIGLNAKEIAEKSSKHAFFNPKMKAS